MTTESFIEDIADFVSKHNKVSTIKDELKKHIGGENGLLAQYVDSVLTRYIEFENSNIINVIDPEEKLQAFKKEGIQT